MREKKPIPDNMRLNVGDEVTFRLYTDCTTGIVIAVTESGQTATVQYCKQVLLNGPDSGEHDALVCTPSGFCAHVEGVQRWEITDDPDGDIDRFSYRPAINAWKQSGWHTHSAGALLFKGHFPYYDYNF